MTRRIPSFVASTAIVGIAIGSALVATESPALASYADCGSQTLCAWDGAVGGGTRYSWGGNWRNTCWNLAPSQNDKISSIYNRLSVNTRFYFYYDCKDSGSDFTVKPGVAATAGQEPWYGGMDNNISSIRFY